MARSHHALPPAEQHQHDGGIATVNDDAVTSTFVFADLAGYAALTEAHGDERAANVAAAFCDELRALLDE
jgi:class 3 adenylate cyclase